MSTKILFLFCTLFLFISALIPWLSNRSWQSWQRKSVPLHLYFDELTANFQQTLGQSPKSWLLNLFVHHKVRPCQKERANPAKQTVKGTFQGFVFHSVPQLMYKRDMQSTEKHINVQTWVFSSAHLNSMISLTFYLFVTGCVTELVIMYNYISDALISISLPS